MTNVDYNFLFFFFYIFYILFHFVIVSYIYFIFFVELYWGRWGFNHVKYRYLMQMKEKNIVNFA